MTVGGVVASTVTMLPRAAVSAEGEMEAVRSVVSIVAAAALLVARMLDVTVTEAAVTEREMAEVETPRRAARAAV